MLAELSMCIGPNDTKPEDDEPLHDERDEDVVSQFC